MATTAGPVPGKPFDTKDWPLNKVVGVKVQIKTTQGEDLTGDVFAYDTNTQMLVLQKSDRKVSVLKTSAIKEMQCLGLPDDFGEDRDLSLPSVNTNALKDRAATAIRKAQDAAENIGPEGIDENTQLIFDAFAATMPTRWHGKRIQVMDVLISEPYKPENCKGGDAKLNERVRKVLENTRAKLNIQ